RRREPPRVVAGARTLDLDHLGPEVAEHLRACRAREHARQVQYTEALQRAGRIFCLHRPVIGKSAGLDQCGRFRAGTPPWQAPAPTAPGTVSCTTRCAP